MHVGTIKEIWRFPVKSMGGERISAANIDYAGFADDRTWAVRDDETNEIATARRIPKLMMLKARYLTEPTTGFGPVAASRVEIEFPDGRRVSSDDPYASAILSMYLGKRVTLIPRPAARDKAAYRLTQPMSPREIRYILGMAADDPDPDFSWFSLKVLTNLSKYTTPPGALYDVYPLHFITTAALDSMNAIYPEGNFCSQRYRPSFVIETNPELTGIVENSWRGRELRIGDALIRCNHPTIRCSMPGTQQPGIHQDPNVPLTVMRHAGQHLGAYASPRNRAAIQLGDSVELVDQASTKLYVWFDDVGRRVKSQVVKAGNRIAQWQEQKRDPSSALKSPYPRGFRPFTLVKREQESSDIISLWFQDPERSELPRFVPGQHIVLAIPQLDDGLVYRPYTLSSPGHQLDSFRISVKREVGTVSGESAVGRGSGWLHDQLAVGDSVAIKDPNGQFGAVPTDSQPLALICTSIGITPMLSILQSVAKENPERDVRLFHGIRDPQDFAFQGALEALKQHLANFHLQLFVTGQGGERPVGSHAGRMTPERVYAALPDVDKYDVLICGKPAFSKAFHDGLLACGIASERLHYESFGASLGVDDGDQTAYRIHFSQSEQTVNWNPAQESLLSFAEEQGIDANSGCRYGACQACECTLLSGEVSYPEDIQPPGGKNKILLCSARPKSDLTLAL
ncbi:MOSC N-terminal beta barrel domain-containing protein [uncultured Spongiibacter sp.]|uniref:MOSC N-terminal beta barrel domain-containing protein n=1 Tax=uncultured Spongiibacter sp. TaxID=870896 RepID=UPI0025883AB7|nr:MOSC N-terminal beta barrel domain-containing protein [uncultured Spongiibacter sp.]